MFDTNLGVEKHNIHAAHESAKHDGINACQCNHVTSCICLCSGIGAEHLEGVGFFRPLNPRLPRASTDMIFQVRHERLGANSVMAQALWHKSEKGKDANQAQGLRCSK